MWRKIRGLTFAVVVLNGVACSSTPTAPTQSTTTTPQLSITPNPLAAVVGPFILPQTGSHPFALSHVVIQYQGITNVPLTVNTGEWKLVLTDGTMGMQHGDPAAGLKIPAGGHGMFTYDVNDQPGGDVFMLYQTQATQRNGTLTVTWTYTADNGSTGTLTASAAVAGS